MGDCFAVVFWIDSLSGSESRSNLQEHLAHAYACVQSSLPDHMKGLATEVWSNCFEPSPGDGRVHDGHRASSEKRLDDAVNTARCNLKVYLYEVRMWLLDPAVQRRYAHDILKSCDSEVLGILEWLDTCTDFNEALCLWRYQQLHDITSRLQPPRD